MWPNPQETANLVTFIDVIVNGKLQFLGIKLCFTKLSIHWRIFLHKRIHLYSLNSYTISKKKIERVVYIKTVPRYKNYWHIFSKNYSCCSFFVLLLEKIHEAILQIESFSQLFLTLFRMGGAKRPLPTSFSSVISTNVRISPQRFLTFSVKPFATLV